MRKAGILLLTLLLVLALPVTGFAATAASKASLSAAVSSNGSCQVTLDLQLHLDSAPEDLDFPLPRNARGVTLNGSNARTRRSGDVLNVDLSNLLGGATGDFSLRLQYTLPNVVDYNALGKLELQLPLLSGFLYPIDSMDFSVTLPGENTLKPAFSSGYYQQSIEADMEFTPSGNTLTGSVLSQLKDRETLTMTLEVSEEMFPQDPMKQWTMGADDIAMIVLAVLALLYWILFLRCAPFLRSRTSASPEGYAAGELCSALTGQGADLTMLVFSWAQLGYLLIHLEDNGRVMLHKRMDMGNERSANEVRIFRSLFGKRTIVDGTGNHYANLFRKVEAAAPDVRELYRRSSGNPMVLRVLCATIGVFGGISLGNAIVGDALLGILLTAVLAILGGISAWFMQPWFKGAHLRRKDILWLSLGLGGIWLLIGTAAGEWNVALGMVAAQFICGVLWAYGGRRTPLGRQTVSQILGFRRYLRRLPAADAQRLSQSDPEYFFSQAPYALAFGIQRQFAKRFGKLRLPACPYLTTGMDGHMTAPEWSQVMEQAVSALDARQKRLPLERLLGR